MPDRTGLRNLLAAVYLGIWMFTILFFWLFTSRSDAFGFSLLFLWILLPVTTLIISFLIGLNNFWGKWKWASVIDFGVMYMLAEYLTFSLANMTAFSKFNLPDFGLLALGMIISAVGLGIGSLVCRNTKCSE